MTDTIPEQQQSPAGRVIRNITHGGVTEPPVDGLTDDSNVALTEPSTPFDYLFEGIKDDPGAHLPADDPAAVAEALRTVGKLLLEPQPSSTDPFQSTDTSNSTIPAVYTYLGQFIDHDITANTDRLNDVGHVVDPDLHPVAPDEVVAKVRNKRVPALDLDSVYGDGPTFPGEPDTDAKSFYDGIKLKLGKVALIQKDGNPPPGSRIPLHADLDRDLPRGVGAGGRGADIGDGRNDENLIVAQLHVAFLRFHNATVDWVRAHEAQYCCDKAVFTRAQQLVRWHYQWLVVHDYLPTIALPGVVDEVLLGASPPLYSKRNGEAYMPLEFSVAAFRFGHTMVRGAYDFNRNFGRPGRVITSAGFELLFTFTGRGGFLGQTDVLPFNWVIEWDRFVERDPRFPDHFSRKIDTRLAADLGLMKNELVDADPAATDLQKEILQQLAMRNLLRGYQLSIPTGQAIAGELGLPALTVDELTEGNSTELNEALEANGFLERTPLWYYVLKEAEVQAGGNSLGELGSRIVVETLIGQIRNDPGSYLAQQPSWTPEQGVLLTDGRPVLTMKEFFRFAGLLPTRP